MIFLCDGVVSKDTICVISLPGSVMIFRIKLKVFIMSFMGNKKIVMGRNSILSDSNNSLIGKTNNLTIIFRATFMGKKRSFTKM